MSDNKIGTGAQVLHWPGKVFTADDLRRHWAGQRELSLTSRALLTPLAVDELRARGIRITRQEVAVGGGAGNTASAWGYWQEKPDSLVASAVAGLGREGLTVALLPAGGNSPAAAVRSVAAWLDKKNHGSVLFGADAALLVLLANKVPGLRAAAVTSALHTARALTTVGANVLVVEMPGRTYFEVRQILRTAVSRGAPACPPELAKMVQELEAHAHR